MLVNCAGQTIFVADAHRDDGKRFDARSDEMLTAFLGITEDIPPPLIKT